MAIRLRHAPVWPRFLAALRGRVLRQIIFDLKERINDHARFHHEIFFITLSLSKYSNFTFTSTYQSLLIHALGGDWGGSFKSNTLPDASEA